MKAYSKFKEIDSLNDNVDKHRAWLKDYEGKKYSKALNGVDLIKWKNTKYSNINFDTDINKVGELKNRLRIEFDDHLEDGTKDKNKIQKHIEYICLKLKELNIGYIRSTHNGASDYIWIESNRDLTSEEKKKFLKWIAPKDSEIDLNFASYNFCFPVLFAIHWKHSNYRELPVEYFEGEQFDYDSLKIRNIRGKTINSKETNFNYKTFRASSIFSRKKQGEFFNELQPIFYDRIGNFWLWNLERKCWELTDEVDLLNIIEKSVGLNVISSKDRTEIINTLKQEGRKNIPQNIKKTWIQFNNQIIDISNGERFEATPKFFVTNPIPHNISGISDTPRMDKIFTEWVGKENIQLLYEIIAYCCLADYPIHRLFCFIGIGMNGKSCYLTLLKRFIGLSNVTSTELDTLLNSRFEVTKLHKKLACIMGETNFNQLSKTSILKRLTGGDLMGFEYKNKTPFDDMNYAKILIATNNLPETDDKTLGFYRRWLIVDFPNSFNEKKDILCEIPTEEYDNLATKVIFILNKLIETREFTNEGTIEERTKKFEDKSNPIDKFIKDNCMEDINSHIGKNDFEKKLNKWCNEKKFRTMSDSTIGKKMKDRGIESGRIYLDWLFDGKGGQIPIWRGLKWKE